MLKMRVYKLLREIQFISPFRRYFFPRYFYHFTVPQLCFLCRCIEKTKDVRGSIVEVGCAGGATTVFLNKYMDAQKIQKKYYAIDTFSGFVNEDIEFEVINRGKCRDLYTGFQVNKQKWFDGTMRLNNIERVRSIQADVNRCCFTELAPLSFVFLDVDLYRPMRKTLKELYDVLSPGGIIIVDDCNPDNISWDGSDQAYKEFSKEINQPARVVHGKLGIIKKTV